MIKEFFSDNKKIEELFSDESNPNFLKQSSFWVKSLSWTLIVFSGGFLAWLAFAETEEVIIVKGKLSPIGKVKEIKIPVGGIVNNILVEEGQLVKTGESLISLDTDNISQELISLKERLLLSNQQLESKKQERNNLNNLINEKVKTAKNKYIIERNVLERIKKLADEGAIPSLMYLKQESKVINLEGQIKITKLKGNSQFLILENDKKELQSNISQLKSQINNNNLILEYKVIKSPVEGIVFNLKPTALGFVLNSSEPVMNIVPLNKLEALVDIPSRKIGFVNVNMSADISPDSFPANDFGTLPGKIISIGSDALQANSQVKESEYFYPGRIQLDQQEIKLKDGSKLKLKVGMSVTANIKLRKTSYLKILLRGFQDKVDSIKQL